MAKLVWMTLRYKGIITAAALVAFFFMVWIRGGKVDIEEVE